ncbi:DUF3800 domain-containing protein [Roseovarius rhodophyticola]|uniref:DUF3800 domain-containing protein n=1 Tax=Roseovarius rhodophyticola TaxID=3080827 RepID=A0ABZ2TIB8_9RHOB|nr:DUF3800 domain-containing protein [Roseovarius sp. W115]MDV2929704.1 DUF3800 domain-containing protein [Roseovarius sp. W115]
MFIDESGDTGVSSIRSSERGGSSEYFAMGAVVMQPATMTLARKLMDQLQHDFGKQKRWKHATNLNHSQKLHFCKSLSKLHVRFFGLISYKPTLGDYAEDIDWEPDKFYNKCAKYLLERVGAYIRQIDLSLSEPRIVFEERNHNYDAMIRYMSCVKENPIYQQSKSLDVINPFGITKKSKREEDLLRVADMVSHAIYSCVNKTPENFGITEPRYLRELAPRFAANPKGHVLGTGLKPIHDIKDMALDPEILQALSGLRAKPMPTR